MSAPAGKTGSWQRNSRRMSESFDFSSDPIFIECHGQEKQKGDYRLDSAEDALAAGDSELPAIVPYRPRESYLVDLITLPVEADEVMPPEGKAPLTSEEIVEIIRWIHDGAPFGDPDSAVASD